MLFVKLELLFFLLDYSRSTCRTPRVDLARVPRRVHHAGTQASGLLQVGGGGGVGIGTPSTSSSSNYLQFPADFRSWKRSIIQLTWSENDVTNIDS